MLHRRSFLGGLPLLAAGGPATFRILDKATGRETAARIRLVDAQGAEAVPLGHAESLEEGAREGDVRIQSRRFAYVDGRFTLDPRRLPLKYQVVKGYEYLMAEGELRAQGPFDIPLTRWSELSRKGWQSGDIHIHHIAPKTCRLEMEAEDLNVANILTSDFTLDQDRFEGQASAHSGSRRLIYVTQEFRNDQLGHLCLLNLKRLIEPVKPMRHEHYPLLLDVCDQTRRQGGYVSWAHFPSWPGAEGPLDVALEKVDGLEILSQLDPREFPIYMRNLVPELAANNGLRLWYRYLNCGFRLTATAGTDKMTTFVTAGANRVFARVDGEFTCQAWIDALRAGRTFVTNSPLLKFTVNGREAGTTLSLDSKKHKALEIHARAESQLPYDRLEILVNGETVAEAAPGGSRHRAEIRLTHPLRSSCWVAARASEDPRRYKSRGVDFTKVHSASGTSLSDCYGTRRPEVAFAHSSPVYVLRDGRPIRSWDDADYYVRYLDNTIRWLETQAKFARPADREASIEAFRRGRAVFLQRAQEGGL
ncbi:MAG: CehA/McbA family metallohydrolase [Acidobacteria bacterium]|nr:CehA/McbA family metallohydrolase [Acidobacteriota bacterium]